MPEGSLNNQYIKMHRLSIVNGGGAVTLASWSHGANIFKANRRGPKSRNKYNLNFISELFIDAILGKPKPRHLRLPNVSLRKPAAQLSAYGESSWTPGKSPSGRISGY
jgi:hypothetical protein